MADKAQTSRRLSFDRIATTEDTDDPVIRAELPDTGSWMTVILETEPETIRVAYVESKARGDMAWMLDEVVRQMGWNDVLFLSPLNDQLVDRLHGFSEETEYIEERGEELTYLEGVWHPGD